MTVSIIEDGMGPVAVSAHPALSIGPRRRR